MKRNKKWIAMGAGLGIGAVMLTVSGLSAMAGNSGYEAWKTAVKQTHTATSFAGKAGIVVTDNGTKLIDAEAAFKKDGASASADLSLSSGNAAHGMNVYIQDGQTVLKPDDSNVYRVVEQGTGEEGKHGPKRGADHTPDPAMVQNVERVFDALVGNLKDRVTLTENADGSQQVTLSLSGSQVPAAVQAIGSMLIGHAGGFQDKRGHAGVGAGPVSGDAAGDKGSPAGGAGFDSWFTPDMKPELPKLTQDIRIEAIKLDAVIDANRYMDGQTAEIRLSGKDAAGTAHSLVVQVMLDLGGFNGTKADRVDLTGQTVETIKPKERERFNR